MSDAFSARAWQRWQPDDLGSTFKVAEEPQLEEPAADVEMSAGAHAAADA